MCKIGFMRRYYILLCFLITGCSGLPTTLSEQLSGLNDGDKVTVGTVQKEIHEGMTNTEVLEVLGSPNIVTTDDQRRENWVYDKIATQKFVSGSQGTGSRLFGFIPLNANAAYSSSQRTLTIIIKFDAQNKVRDFSYHSSRF
jgi:outer membrane protein assembly factor BamE (lipoprotein component of BamABCDE complex)